ncbi:MAG: hypothetical protein K1X64_20845 [Myxococcaceae bacterium]|nr:hypothetical protein [Myxococcaceae bacterium]
MKTPPLHMFVIVGALCAAGCMCGIEDTQTLQPHQPADAILTQVTLELTFQKASTFFQRPTKVTGLLALSIDAESRVSGVLSFPGESTSLAQVHGRLEGQRVTLDAQEVRVPPDSSFGWTRFELEFVESETLWEVAHGSAEGSWQQFGGDVVDSSAVTVKLSGVADVGPATASVEPLQRSAYRFTLWPTDALRIRFNEPVDHAKAMAKIRVLSNNQVVPGALTSTPVLGRVTSLEFHPSIGLPFAAPVRLDLGGLTDLRGNAANAPAAVPVVADPGSLLNNPSFEKGLEGWSVLGSEGKPAGAFKEVLPADGSQQLVLRQDTGVAGYFDVPMTATTLSFSLAFFAESQFVSAAYSGTVRLFSPGEPPQLLFDGAAHVEDSVDCNCSEFSRRFGPQRLTADLVPLRGRRVFLVAEARSAQLIGNNSYALVLDDVKVQ